MEIQKFNLMYVLYRAQDCDRSLSVTVNGEEAKILHSGIAEIKGEEKLLPYNNYFYALEKVTTKFYKVIQISSLSIYCFKLWYEINNLFSL